MPSEADIADMAAPRRVITQRTHPPQSPDEFDTPAPGGPPASRRAPAWREAVHGLLIAIGWTGFAWMWIIVARQSWSVAGLAWVFGASLLVLPLLTGAWVLHNRAIHRRKGERRGVPAAAMDYTHDWHGRTVHADWTALRRSRCVVVDATDDAKWYRRPDCPPAGPRAPQPDALDSVT